MLKFHTLEQIIGYYLQKYSDGSEFMVKKSLTYFEDADFEETPVLFEEMDWLEIKTKLIELL